MNLPVSPIWILIPISLGILFSISFYGFNASVSSSLSTPLKILLAFIRGIIVFLIGFLVLDPSLTWLHNQEEKPQILFLQDNSQSILLGKTKNYYLKAYPQLINHLIETLSDKFKVDIFSFGSSTKEGLDYKFQDFETDISPLMESIYSRYEAKNLGAIILATDGIFNKGSDPAEAFRKLHIPIYTLRLGDTTLPRDLIVNQVEYNQVVFIGNKFPIKASISAQNLDGKKIQVYLKQEGQVLQKKEIIIHGIDFHVFVPFETVASTEGTKLYQVYIENLPQETNIINNIKKFTVSVIKAKQDILILSGVTHPDLSAIKEALSSSNNFAVHILSLNEKILAKKYTAVILYQVSVQNLGQMDPSVLAKIMKLPQVRIFGEQSDRALLDRWKGSLDYTLSSETRNFGASEFNPSFRFFNINDSLNSLLAKFPPLHGTYQVRNGYIPENVVVNSIVEKNVQQKNTPILFFSEDQGVKNAWIMGEGIWKWRMFEFSKTGNHHLVDELLQKMISYITLEVNKSRFKVISAKSIWLENELIEMEAEVYNKSYELVNQDPVAIDLTDEHGKAFHYQFTAAENRYRLSIEKLPIGRYTYTAIVQGKEPMETKGVFVVEPSVLEYMNTTANHTLLQAISNESSGASFLPKDIDRLSTLILNNPNLRPILHEKKEFHFWIESPWILGFLLILLISEWALRKWNGFY